jgi:cytochrome c-550 PedF
MQASRRRQVAPICHSWPPQSTFFLARYLRNNKHQQLLAALLTTMKNSSTLRILLATGLAACLSLASIPVMAHGDVVPQSVDTHTLPQLGEKWLENNPYSKGEAHTEALRIGSSAYNQNCARCHGLEAISGGISPDLRKLDGDCMSLGDETKKLACFQEINDYFVSTVRRGRARDGRVYMPPFEGILTQEAMWSIKTYLETRREP